ncbi:MAG: hypothetical protein V1784_01920, partial [bacterium]
MDRTNVLIVLLVLIWILGLYVAFMNYQLGTGELASVPLLTAFMFYLPAIGILLLIVGITSKVALARLPPKLKMLPGALIGLSVSLLAFLVVSPLFYRFGMGGPNYGPPPIAIIAMLAGIAVAWCAIFVRDALRSDGLRSKKP